MSVNKGVIHSVAEFEHITEMQENLRRKLVEAKHKDSGRLNTIRTTVLAKVVAENYDAAADEIRAYVTTKVSYPGFQDRVERLVNHCTELIQAIHTKRNFPGLASLSLSKQQEIHEKVLEHFDDLKQHLKHIEKVEREHKLDDLRSTVWVLKAFARSVFLVVMMAFILDVRDGRFSTLFSVSNTYLDNLATWVVSFIHF